MLPHTDWQDLGIKLLGKPLLFNIFQELERALVDQCDPALLEEGSAVRKVEVAGEPPCLRAARCNLFTTDKSVCASLESVGGQGFRANFTRKTLKAIGWDVEEMLAADNRKVWIKPCLYGVSHLRDFKWLRSRDEVQWVEARQRLPRLLPNGQITMASSLTAWKAYQNLRQAEEAAGRPWADGLRAQNLLLQSAVVDGGLDELLTEKPGYPSSKSSEPCSSRPHRSSRSRRATSPPVASVEPPASRPR